MFTFTDGQKEELLKWADELEHTQKPQTISYLRDVNGFCCLGVLCDMQERVFWGLSWGPDEERYYIFDRGYYLCLPDDLANKLGLLQMTSDIDPDAPISLQSLFQEMNDDCLFSFAKIAKEIRHLVKSGSFSKPTQKKLSVRQTATLSEGK